MSIFQQTLLKKLVCIFLYDYIKKLHGMLEIKSLTKYLFLVMELWNLMCEIGSVGLGLEILWIPNHFLKQLNIQTKQCF